MNSALYAEVLSRQRILVLQRRSAEDFRSLGLPPPWSAGLLPAATGETQVFSPAVVFPFLENFLPDAERFWTEKTDGELRSGIWVELAPDGSELHLVAMACFAAAEKLLLVRRLEREFDELQRVYQKGRELLLTHERLLAETGKKEILLHCIIHDLAGPLAGIKGALEFLEGDQLSEKGLKFVQLSHRAARQQSLMIDDLLATFRSEMGTLETLDPDPGRAPDVLACAREVLGALTPAFASRGVQSRFEIASGLPEIVRVRGEKSRLERVFHNLLQNALRYSKRGDAVRLVFGCEEDGVRICVEDEGPGVPPEVLPQLFQKFVRGSALRGKAGLGLYFCRISVEQWGGEIGCETRAEGGTRFWFRLKQV